MATQAKVNLVFVATCVRHLPSLRGRGALGQRLAERAGTDTQSVEIKMNRGHVMSVPRSSRQTWTAAFTGSYDDPELDLLSEFIVPGEWALDIGASLGFYTIALAKYGNVVAVEPVAGNRLVLRRNIELNRMQSRVQVLPIALGPSRSTMAMEVEAGGVGNAALSDGVPPEEMRRHQRDGHLDHHVESIDVFPLDEVVDLPSSRCAVVKIDVEGFELEVLAGSSQFISLNRPTIFGEFSGEWLRSRGKGPEALIDWAKSKQYGLLGLRQVRSNPLSDRYVMVPTRYKFGAPALLVP